MGLVSDPVSSVNLDVSSNSVGLEWAWVLIVSESVSLVPNPDHSGSLALDPVS